MKEILLNSGLATLVDDKDFELLSQWNWFAFRKSVTSTWYARRNIRVPHKSTQYLHRFILDPSPDCQVDHIDGNGLNNQRSNLRICTGSENQMNKVKQSRNTSGFKGVTWHKLLGKWMAQIGKDNAIRFLGYFDYKIEAANVYDDAALELHGEYAKTNFPFIYG